MSEFIEVPVSKKSLVKRKPVFGVGINNSAYKVYAQINGKQVACPYYRRWVDMLQRCYCPKFQEKNPTYIGCAVAKEWLTFSAFREWMAAQDWAGKQLDKDLLVPNNKEYSPGNCLFVSSAINNILTDSAAKRGGLPQGVCWHKMTGKYRAYCRVNGRQKYLGYFDKVKDAEVAYLEFKSELVIQTAEFEDGSTRGALIRHAEIMRERVSKITKHIGLESAKDQVLINQKLAASTVLGIEK